MPGPENVGGAQRKWVTKKKAGTEVWFGLGPEDLPYKKLGLLDPELFVSYSGPDTGIVLVHELEHGRSGSPKHGKGRAHIAGAQRWNLKNRKCYGICMSLYDQHPINGKISGDPVADAFAVSARKNNACLIVADGVNWGEKSKMAARCAVYGAMKFVHEQLFTDASKKIKTTHEVFTMLLESLTMAHKTILKHDAGLTTLCVTLVLPTRSPKQFVVCIVNVGDSLAYVYSKFHGIREITTGSHDIQSERDIRDAGGALGPVHGTKPELNNLTCSMTYVDKGDIIYLTTDGISDNFDPVVTKIAVAKRIAAPKVHDDIDPIESECRSDNNGDKDLVENESETPQVNVVVTEKDESQPLSNERTEGNSGIKETTETKDGDNINKNISYPGDLSGNSSQTTQDSNVVDSLNNIQVVETNNKQTPTNQGTNDAVNTNKNGQEQPGSVINQVSAKNGNITSPENGKKKNLGSPVTNEHKRNTFPEKKPKSPVKLKDVKEQSKTLGGNNSGNSQPDTSTECGTKDGKPEMEPHERHQYAVKEMERVLLEFELSTEETCCAQEVCGGLLQHVLKLTDSKRKVLENPNLYGRRLKRRDRETRDTEICSMLSKAPGKLDHATIVAYEVGCFRGDEDEDYELTDPENDTLGSDSGSAMTDIVPNTPTTPRRSTTTTTTTTVCTTNVQLPTSQQLTTSPIHNPAMDIPFIDDSDQSDC